MTNSIDETDFLTKLPTPPGVAVQLLNLYSSDEVSLDDLQEVIQVDPTLTSRIIKYSNSPTFARRHEAKTLTQAIRMLGSNGVKMIALSFTLTEIGTSKAEGYFRFDEFWGASLATAISAKATYHCAKLDEESGFLIGLLMNIGQMALYCHNPDRYESLIAGKTVCDISLIDLENKEYGESRYSMGAKVLRSWNFPETISQAVESLDEPADPKTTETRVLELANKMSYLFRCDSPDFEIIESFSNELASLSELDEEQVEELYCSSLAEYAEVASILSYTAPPMVSLRDLELEAKTSLVELSFDLQLASASTKAENNELKNMAFVDALTGLGNRRQYESVAQAELDRCSRMGHPLCLIVIDIDRFKHYNDTYGHAVGDQILTELASRMKNTLRSYDYIFRFGGDEFVILITESELEGCKAIAERIRKAVYVLDFDFEGQSMAVTISLGGAVYKPGDSNVIADLFSRADAALYHSKDGGRNQSFFANDLMETLKKLEPGIATTKTTPDSIGLAPDVASSSSPSN